MKHQKTLLSFLTFSSLVVFLTGCNASPPNERWVIFSEQRARQMEMGTWLASDAEFDGYWTPTEEDIQNLESKLDAFLRESAESFNQQPPVGAQLNTYKRQYVGLNVSSKQVIYGNFFCTETGVNWREEWVLVMDGGDCFFQLKFDVESGSFTSLTVNGEA